MKAWLWLTLGLLAVVVGLLWTVQGLGYLPGGLMSGDRVWTVAGAVVALTGLAALRHGLRIRRR